MKEMSDDRRRRRSKSTAVIGALYHPPKPIYAVSDLLCHIDACLDTIASDMPSALVVIAGDFKGIVSSKMTYCFYWPDQISIFFENFL